MHVHPGMANNVAGESFPCRRTEKPFSIFRAQKTGRFVNQPPNESFEMPAPHFSKMIDHRTFKNFPTRVSKNFRSTPVKKTNVCRIGRKWVRFELQVHFRML